QPAVHYVGGPNNRGVFVGDFNNDNKLDLITSNPNDADPLGNSSSVSVLLGNGNGTFQPRLQTFLTPGTHPTWLALADLNHDGNLDVVTADPGNNTLGILLGQGNGQFQAP